MHLLRGNIGSGVFAMGDGFKNGGLLLAPILTLCIGMVSVHSQHILVIKIQLFRVIFTHLLTKTSAQSFETNEGEIWIRK